MRRTLKEQIELQEMFEQSDKREGAGSWMTQKQAEAIQGHLRSTNFVLNSIGFETKNDKGTYNQPYEIDLKTAYRPDLVWVLHYWTVDGTDWMMRIQPDGTCHVVNVTKALEECIL